MIDSLGRKARIGGLVYVLTGTNLSILSSTLVFSIVTVWFTTDFVHTLLASEIIKKQKIQI